MAPDAESSLSAVAASVREAMGTREEAAEAGPESASDSGAAGLLGAPPPWGSATDLGVLPEWGSAAEAEAPPAAEVKPPAAEVKPAVAEVMPPEPSPAEPAARDDDAPGVSLVMREEPSVGQAAVHQYFGDEPSVETPLPQGPMAPRGGQARVPVAAVVSSSPADASAAHLAARAGFYGDPADDEVVLARRPVWPWALAAVAVVGVAFFGLRAGGGDPEEAVMSADAAAAQAAPLAPVVAAEAPPDADPSAASGDENAEDAAEETATKSKAKRRKSRKTNSAAKGGASDDDPTPSASADADEAQESEAEDPAQESEAEDAPAGSAASGDSSAADLLAAARKASLAGDAKRAYELAERSYQAQPSEDAALLMGISACKQGETKRAEKAYAKLSSKRSKLDGLCQQMGIQLGHGGSADAKADAAAEEAAPESDAEADADEAAPAPEPADEPSEDAG